jgi:tetratricopeptide (TPR) repeat protein
LALNTLNDVLQSQSDHVKALYIKGKTLVHTGDTAEAILVLKKALQLDSDNVEIKKELTKAQLKHKVQYENEKRMYKKMMDGVSPEAEIKKLKSLKKSKGNSETGIITYVAIAGAVVAASVGLAVLLKYKNNLI